MKFTGASYYRPVMAQLLLEGAGFYEQKSQRVDATAAERPVLLRFSDAGYELDGVQTDVAGLLESLSSRGVRSLQLYAYEGFPSDVVAPFSLPMVSRFAPETAHASGVTISRPCSDELPEAVDPEIFDWALPPKTDELRHRVIGSLHRHPDGLRLTELTFTRLSRFREDLDWNVFDSPPTLDEIREIDLWVDLAAGESDFDGWTAEALVAGIPVVATRTEKNAQRLIEGRCGTLVRRNDPNEFAHAILNVLFKPELREPKLEIARCESERFRPEVRLGALRTLHEGLAG